MNLHGLLSHIIHPHQIYFNAMRLGDQVRGMKQMLDVQVGRADKAGCAHSDYLRGNME